MDFRVDGISRPDPDTIVPNTGSRPDPYTIIPHWVTAQYNGCTAPQGSLTSSLGTRRDYVKTRTTLFSGSPNHPYFCINKLAPSVRPDTRGYFEKKIINLSIGGTLTLIKSILGSLPIYYFSLFKAPKKIINLLESIRFRFFWGFKESQRGICWVKWNSILVNANMGEKDALWRLVIKDFYGDDGGFGSSLGSNGNIGTWLPTRANLISRGVPLALVFCPFCENEEEGIEHCLIRCPRVMPIWRKVWSWWQLPTPVTFPSFLIMDIALGKLVTHDSLRLKKVIHGVFQSALWAVWKWRNKLINSPPEAINIIRGGNIPVYSEIDEDLDFCSLFFAAYFLELLDFF
nr:RNA-directed DNA polymerase, eukaryota, reverse transcriptase zinc-binding domain protein [Tanacetum cinerariifolium]